MGYSLQDLSAWRGKKIKSIYLYFCYTSYNTLNQGEKSIKDVQMNDKKLVAFICCKESILLLLFESIWINLGYYKSTENYSNWSALFILIGIISSRKSIPPYTGHEGSLSGLNSMLIIWYDLHSHQISTQFNNYGSFWTDILDRGLYHHHQIPIKNGVHSSSAFPKLCRIDAKTLKLFR